MTATTYLENDEEDQDTISDRGEIRKARPGDSNSNQYEGHILTKMELAGRIKTKYVSAGRKRG